MYLKSNIKLLKYMLTKRFVGAFIKFKEKSKDGDFTYLIWFCLMVALNIVSISIAPINIVAWIGLILCSICVIGRIKQIIER